MKVCFHFLHAVVVFDSFVKLGLFQLFDDANAFLIGLKLD